MLALVQRVLSACVKLPDEENRVHGAIGCGMLVLLGIDKKDDLKISQVLASRLLSLRCFEGKDPDKDLGASYKEASSLEKKKIRRPPLVNAMKIKADILVVSQFTLCADLNKGTKPSFHKAASAAVAQPLYHAFLTHLRAQAPELQIAEGCFGAQMHVALTGDGPYTLLLEE